MVEKTPQEILDDLHAAQIEAQKAGLIDQRAETDAVIGEAQSAKIKENAGAGADYNNYQKTNAGKSETSGMYAYNAYRSRLSAAAKAAQNAKEKADLSYNMAEANAKANLSNAQAAEQAARSDQHWQQEQWDYQLAVDEAARLAKEEAERAAEEAQSAAANQTTSRRSSSYVTDNSAAIAEAEALAMKPINTVTDIVSHMKNRSEADKDSVNKEKSINELMEQAKAISDNGKLLVFKKNRDQILNEAIALGYDKNSEEYKSLLFYLKGRAGTSSYYF